MHMFWGTAYEEGNLYTVSNHWETPPIDCVVQTMIVGYFNTRTATSPVHSGTSQIAITAVEYLDDEGVTRRNDYGPSPRWNPNPCTNVWQTKLVRFDWVLDVGCAKANYLMNVFIW
jgi:hypothetical protein